MVYRFLNICVFLQYKREIADKQENGRNKFREGAAKLILPSFQKTERASEDPYLPMIKENHITLQVTTESINNRRIRFALRVELI